MLAALLLLAGCTAPQTYSFDWGEARVCTPAAAAEANTEVTAAQVIFEEAFGVPAPKGIVVDARFNADTEKTEELVYVMPWTFEEQDEPPAELVESIRSQIVTQLEAAGIEPTEERVDAAVAQALAQRAAQTEEPDDESVKPLRHEVGHKLFIEAVWPNTSGGRTYGGSAPDWLDEAAAVLVEDDVLTERRRDQFARLVREDKLTPLAQFLTMEHPLYGVVSQIIEEGGAEGGVLKLTAEDFAARGIDVDEAPIAFYAQARGFLDYLDATTGRPQTLGIIARGLLEYGSMDVFLEEEGAAADLPASMEALQASFDHWAHDQF